MDRTCGSAVKGLAVLGEYAKIVACLKFLSLRNGDGVSLIAAVKYGILLKLYALPVLEDNQTAGASACLIVLGLGRDCDCLIYACVCRSADCDNGVIGNIVKCFENVEYVLDNFNFS